MIIKDGLAPVNNAHSLIRPYVLSHGTCECRSLKETRDFYENFLGLECVRHAKPGMVFRLGLKFHVVCVEVGDELKPSSLLTHWGLDVASREQVDDAWRKAHEHQERYKIRQILPISTQHGVYSFYMEDLNHMWWEIEYYDGFLHEDFFDFGDRYHEDYSEMARKPSAEAK
jgi:catechol 2,3-dioxygenase-like lactoylglutathione lyase family enzyme